MLSKISTILKTYRNREESVEERNPRIVSEENIKKHCKTSISGKEILENNEKHGKTEKNRKIYKRLRFECYVV